MNNSMPLLPYESAKVDDVEVTTDRQGNLVVETVVDGGYVWSRVKFVDVIKYAMVNAPHLLEQAKAELEAPAAQE